MLATVFLKSPRTLLFLLLTAAAMVNVSNSLSANADKATADRLATWDQRWSNDRTGWHIEDVHKHLQQHGGSIIPNIDREEKETSEGVRVFVPLCGKTVDMAFLAQNSGVSEVVGIDGIQKALDEFIALNPSLNIKESQECNDDGFSRFTGDKITLLRGDFFLMDKASVEKFDAIWDRASIVAIEPDLREDYVRILGHLLKPGGTLLVSTLDKRELPPEARAGGPPYSVPESEIRRLYEALEWVESVTPVSDNEADEKLGIGPSVREVAFVIKTKKSVP